ncbi:MAG: UbiX family flavin prenyltransferase [Pseudomonadota bacterium]|nr:UbiX family flavin prenyltransferase [Pseudomonadota bacterium]
MRLIVGMSGASGVIYGIRMLEVLKTVAEVETHLIISNGAKLNISIETNWPVKEVEALAEVVHNDHNLAASVSSGSFKTDGMIVLPCSMKTLSGIVTSYADTLIVRSADVVLKEHRRLVLVPRETPLHAGHCKLLYEAAMNGAIIAPPMPAFYNDPETLDDIINHTTGRLMDLFGLSNDFVKRWKGANNAAKNR